MRLIDADEIIKETWGVVIKDMFHMDETVDVISRKDINNVPTIEAIPIEWIKKYLHKLEIISKDNLDLGEDGYFREVVAIEDMIYAWGKENE